MADPFLGQIQLVAFNFAPQGWAFCQGQILPISQNTALFSLLGTQYGGNGTSNFALPNLQGCAAVGYGNGPGLSPYGIGQSGGVAAVTLNSATVPAHSHYFPCATSPGHATTPSPSVFLGTVARGESKLYGNSSSGATMAPGALATVGSSAAHNNLMPYVVLNYIIALTGIFPARS